MTNAPYCLPNGENIYGLSAQSRKVIDFLVTNNDEADSFLYQFIMKSTNDNIAVSDYRVHRIVQRDMSLEEFVNYFNNNGVQALEELFMHPVSNEEYAMLTNKINNGKITIAVLYMKHLENRRYRLLKILL